MVVTTSYEGLNDKEELQKMLVVINNNNVNVVSDSKSDQVPSINFLENNSLVVNDITFHVLLLMADVETAFSRGALKKYLWNVPKICPM